MSGWRPREELQGGLCRDRDARFERIVEAIDKHHALMDAGAWPVHGCALPAGWPEPVTIAMWGELTRKLLSQPILGL